MSQSTTAAPQGAVRLAEQFALEGFTPGTPDHVGLEAQAIDRRVCRALKCPRCRRRGMEYRPFHRDRVYRVAAVCPCGGAEEV